MPARRIALGAVSIFVIMVLHLSAQQGQPWGRTAGDTILSYAEAHISDAQRARLVDLMPVLFPVSKWPAATSGENESMPAFVGRVFGVLTDGIGALPKTAAALTGQIRRANDLPAADRLPSNRPLRVPPMPPVTRIGPNQFVQLATSDKMWVTEDSGKTWGSMAFPNGRQPRSAAAHSELRIPGVPAPEVLSALNAIGAVVPSDGKSQLEIPKESSSCGPVEPWVTSSPYFSRAVARIRAAKAQLERLASQNRLAILDFNFDGGHGAEVLSAARTLLIALGIPELGDRIDPIELNPAANGGKARQTLTDLFRQYLKDYGTDHGVSDVIAQPGALWIVTSDSGTDAAAATIEAVVLQAALWHAASTSHWLSLSWWTRKAVTIYPPDWDAFVDSNSVFGVAAAGNDGQELGRLMEPQRSASSFGTWLNVTYGSRDGALTDGNRTRADGGALVDTIGPGCGYSLAPLTLDASGSSYASPFVAAAAWLKHLLDGTTAAQMRREIWFASTLVPQARTAVDSSGVFDAAQLLSGIGPHYVTVGASPHVVEFQSATIDAGSGRVFSSSVMHPASFALIQNATGGFELYVRQAKASIPGGDVSVVAVDPTTFAFRVNDANGSPTVVTASAFLRTIREVVF
jgi:hypothetical protein